MAKCSAGICRIQACARRIAANFCCRGSNPGQPARWGRSPDYEKVDSRGISQEYPLRALDGETEAGRSFMIVQSRLPLSDTNKVSVPHVSSKRNLFSWERGRERDFSVVVWNFLVDDPTASLETAFWPLLSSCPAGRGRHYPSFPRAAPALASGTRFLQLAILGGGEGRPRKVSGHASERVPDSDSANLGPRPS